MKYIFFCFLLCMLLFGCEKYNTSQSSFQSNAIWAESKFLRGYQPTSKEVLLEEHIQQYTQLLKRAKIKYLYLFAGPFDKEGHILSYSFSDVAIRNVKLLKKFYPELIVLPWIGGIQNSTVYLNDSAWVANAVRDSKRLYEVLDVNGLHLDFECIAKGNAYLDSTYSKYKHSEVDAYGDNVNHFHKLLRTSLPKAFISSVVACTSSNVKQWKRKTSMNELKVLLMYVDQVSFLFYDTSIHTQSEFVKACNQQLKDINLLKSIDKFRSKQFLLAIRTFINRKEIQEFRYLSIENIENSLKTISDQIYINRWSPLLDGIAIFCDWETDANEWKQLYENLLI